MTRTIIIWIIALVVIPTSLTWASHPGKKVEGGLEFLPLCPQARNTPNAPDEIRQLSNPLRPSPENIFAGQTLFHFDAKPGPCRVCHGISGNGLGILFANCAPLLEISPATKPCITCPMVNYSGLSKMALLVLLCQLLRIWTTNKFGS